MATGLPIVATNVGGNPNVVLDGETGLLVSANNPKELASAIMHLLKNDNLRKQMGSKGRERFIQNFTLSTMANEYSKLYNEAANDAPARIR